MLEQRQKMRLNLEATLFRPEQADPFFESLQTYRDDGVWLALGNSWLELKKSWQDKTSENVPYHVVGASISGKGSLPEKILGLFEQRHVPVEAGSAYEQKLPPVDPINTKTLSFEMSRIYQKKQGPSRETPSAIIHNVPLWRPDQLRFFSFWVNSYYDPHAEMVLSSGTKKAFLMLKKPRSVLDPPYVVAGCASEEMDIFKFVAEMFPLKSNCSPIRSYVTTSKHHENWNFFRNPMTLDQFACVIYMKYHERV